MQDVSKELISTPFTSLSDQETLLQEAHRRKIIEHVPLIVALFIIAVTGIIGNILTISFYGYRVKRTPTFVMIKLLAIIDLIVCFLIFTTIADLCINIKFTSTILCKWMYFLDHWFMHTSVMILWIISIHRYRRICRPVGRQFTVKSATVAVILSTVFSIIYCSHIFIIYDPVKVNISTSDVAISEVIGHYCTNTDDPNLKDVLVTFHAIDVVSVSFCFITFLFTYGNIWRTVRRHNRKAETIQTAPSSLPPRQRTLPFKHIAIQISNASTKEHFSTDQFTSQLQSDYTTDSFSKPDTGSVETPATIERGTLHTSTRKIKKSSQSSTRVTRERKITLMMFAVTVALVICFTPYFIASVGIRAVSATTEDELNTGMELALSFPFLNSVINPIIFCVFNSKYRGFVKKKIIRC
ncbi:5-hydroxytryptamine receptor 1F-like [Mercenaria mercenaria]|uniref:5-hydroxytryptamine receptor 1F-like n=1 Tax=Mercenaria mercenaria TaxID=6596 RepID=UPI00234EAFED|nr:5-hydroxytryptamine receptor 1F-like [Mercenaria mercenaria]